MKSFVSALALIALSLSAVPAAAQHRSSGAAARITPYVGFLSSGSIADGPFGSNLAMRGSPMYGVQLGLQLAPGIALVGNVGYADSELEAGFPLIGGLSLADSKVLMYDGGIQLRFPAVTGPGTGLVPFIEGGVGGIRHEITTGPLTSRSTNVAFTAGGGIDMQLNHALGIRFMAKDHMSRFDYGEAIGIATEGKRAHNWVLGIGINLGM